jgi:hypothetical protein
VASMKQPPSFVRWTDEDKAQLLSVMSDDSNIMDTQYGRLVVLQKRELEGDAGRMTQEKRDALRKRLDKCPWIQVDDGNTKKSQKIAL